MIKCTKRKDNHEVFLNKKHISYCEILDCGTEFVKSESGFHKRKEKKTYTTPLGRCSFCNNSWYNVLNCKFKNKNFKRKLVWVPRGSAPIHVEFTKER